MKKPKRVGEAEWKAVESPELTEREFKRMRPASQVVPRVVKASRRARGRPKQDVTKESVSMRLSPTVLDHFRGQGPGWQTRINDFLVTVVDVVGRESMPRTEVTKKLWAYIKRSQLQAPIGKRVPRNVAGGSYIRRGVAVRRLREVKR